jgi:hypothetical protein
MVVNQLDIFRAGRGPSEADSKLVVHANAELSGAVALERFQSIARRYSQILQTLGDL